MTSDGDIPVLREASLGLHELFQTLVASGFTEEQAIRMLGIMLAEGPRSSQ